MNSSEQPPAEQNPGVPHITPNMIRAFQSVPHDYDFETQLKFLRRDHPELVKLLMIEAGKDAPDDMKQKKAFARGALMLYNLIQFSSEVTTLRDNLSLEPYVDDNHTVPPLSA